MKLALKVIDNKVYFFSINKRNETIDIIKVFDGQIDIQEFLQLRTDYLNKLNSSQQYQLKFDK